MKSPVEKVNHDIDIYFLYREYYHEDEEDFVVKWLSRMKE